jgi:hypothetical protein
VRELAPDEKANILRGFAEVGATRIIGYLPLYTIRDFLGAEPKALAREAADRGLSAVILGEDECCIKSGALYVYESAALSKLLESYLGRLQDAKWPMEPAAFIRHIAADWFTSDDPIMELIQAAFGENDRSSLGITNGRQA